MTYDIPGRGMFHTDCKKSPSGIMKDLNESKQDEDGTTLHAYECLHCGKIGYYGIQNKTRIIIVKEKMKTEKSGNSQPNRKETRGRKPLAQPSTQVSWRIPYDIYQLLLKEQARLEKETGAKPALSLIFNGLVKKSLG
jgi:hypothetical protein